MIYDEHPYGKGGQPLSEMWDATWECKHGRLPRDPSPACGCWFPLEAGEVKRLPVKRRRRRLRKAA